MYPLSTSSCIFAVFFFFLHLRDTNCIRVVSCSSSSKCIILYFSFSSVYFFFVFFFLRVSNCIPVSRKMDSLSIPLMNQSPSLPSSSFLRASNYPSNLSSSILTSPSSSPNSILLYQFHSLFPPSSFLPFSLSLSSDIRNAPDSLSRRRRRPPAADSRG